MQLGFPGQALGGRRALGAEGKIGTRNLPEPLGDSGSAFSPFGAIPACSQFSQLALLGTVPSCWASAGGTSWGRVRVLKAGRQLQPALDFFTQPLEQPQQPHSKGFPWINQSRGYTSLPEQPGCRSGSVGSIQQDK